MAVERFSRASTHAFFFLFIRCSKDTAIQFSSSVWHKIHPAKSNSNQPAKIAIDRLPLAAEQMTEIYAMAMNVCVFPLNEIK